MLAFVSRVSKISTLTLSFQIEKYRINTEVGKIFCPSQRCHTQVGQVFTLEFSTLDRLAILTSSGLLKVRYNIFPAKFCSQDSLPSSTPMKITTKNFICLNFFHAILPFSV